MNRQQTISSWQVKGFTLLELMVALMVFAMLALAGWQITDSLSKSRESTKQQLEQLTNLKYAYLQLSQDFSQVVNYVVNTPNQPIKPTLSLTSQDLEFIRFANPDPRYISPPILEKIHYAIVDNQLIKYKDYQLQTNHQKTVTQAILLTNIENAQWFALTPEKVNQFATTEMTNNIIKPFVNHTNSPNDSNGLVNMDLTNYQQLPKGIELQFHYHGQPIVWKFALPSQPPNQVKVE